MQGERAAKLLAEKLPGAFLRTEESFGEVTTYVVAKKLEEVALLLREDADGQYTFPVHVTAVDHPDREPEAPRFDVVYQLRSLAYNDCCRIVAQVSEAEPHIASLEGVYAGMDWHERETFDLLGIIFDGHHDLRRILLPIDWDGHPLRKDYVSFGEPVAFTHNLEWALPAQERPRDMPGEHR